MKRKNRLNLKLFMDYNTDRPLTPEEFKLIGGPELMRQQAELDEIARINEELAASDNGRLGKIGQAQVRKAAEIGRAHV